AAARSVTPPDPCRPQSCSARCRSHRVSQTPAARRLVSARDRSAPQSERWPRPPACYGSESEEREMTAQQPKVDLENMPAPAEGILVTHFLIVRDVARSRAFYADVLGGQVVVEENPCIAKLANSWIIMNPGGGT